MYRSIHQAVGHPRLLFTKRCRGIACARRTPASTQGGLEMCNREPSLHSIGYVCTSTLNDGSRAEHLFDSRTLPCFRSPTRSLPHLDAITTTLPNHVFHAQSAVPGPCKGGVAAGGEGCASGAGAKCSGSPGCVQLYA